MHYVELIILPSVCHVTEHCSQDRSHKCISVLQAHLPRRAMTPQPRNTQLSAYKSFLLLASRISRLNRNSCASSSTNPVYMRIPALIASRMPETAVARVEPGLYVVRTPRPTAMPSGVVMP